MSSVAEEIVEVETLLTTATFAGVKGVLQTYLAKLKKSEEDRIQREKAKAEKAATSSSSSSPSSTQKPASFQGTYIPIEDFAWDQGEYNSPTVSIFVDLEGVGEVKDRVQVDFSKNSFDLRVVDLKGKNYRLLKDNLEKDIIPEKSKIIVKANKVVVKLQKVKGEYSYEHWASLVNKKKKTEGAAGSDAKKDPMGGLMDMMKDMYEDGDDNMRKIIGEAMLKSQRGEKSEPLSPPDLNGDF